MPDELPGLEPDVGGAELPAVDTGDDGGDEGYADDLAAELEAGRDEPDDSGDDEPGYSADIKRAIEESGNALAEAEVKASWESKWSDLYRSTLEGHGLTPEQAQQQGITREAATERLFAAERLLQTDTPRALAWLAQSYAGKLDPTARAEAAGQILRALGFEHGSQISQAERQQLEQWRAYQAQEASSWQAAEANAEKTIAEFAQGKPDFATLRPLMASIMQSGAAIDLASAYALAKRVQQGGAAPAQAANPTMAPPSAIAKARAARTPKSSSYGAPASADDGDDDTSYASVLKAEFRKAASGGGR